MSHFTFTWVILNNFKKVFQRWRKADTSSTFDYTRKRVSLRNVDRMNIMSVSGRPYALTEFVFSMSTHVKICQSENRLSERVAFSTIKN